MYFKEDFEKLSLVDNNFPGFYPNLRGESSLGYKAEPFEISQDVFHPTPASVNEILKKDFSHLPCSLTLLPDKATRSGFNPGKKLKINDKHKGISIFQLNDFEKIFEDLDVTKFPVYIYTDWNAFPITTFFFSLFEKK